MKVYRVLEKQELDKILNNQCGDLGSFSCEYSDFNNHKYEKNKKYMHFFLRKKSCKYLPTQNNKDLFLCTFNIPLKVLWKHIGKGYYPSLNKKLSHGYNPVIVTLYEFALDSSLFKASWLVEFKKLNLCEYLNSTLQI